MNDRLQRRTLRLPTMELLERRRDVADGHGGFPGLCPEGQLLHLAVHAFISGGRRLSWMKDLQLATTRGVDWDLTSRLARRWGVGPAVGAILGRADRLLDLSLPDDPPRSLRSPWHHVIAVSDRVLPPELDHLSADGRTGTELLWASRATWRGSVRALRDSQSRSRRLARRLDHAVNPLHLDVPDAAARRRWLAALSAPEEP